MTTAAELREHVPKSCRNLLEMSDTELKSEIPALARDSGRMGEIEQAVKSLPSEHELYQGDARNLSMLADESVDLVVTSPPYFNLKEYENGTGGKDQLGDMGDYESFNREIDRVWRE